MTNANCIVRRGANRALLRHALAAALTTVCFSYSLAAQPTPVDPEPVYQKAVSSRLNATGRTITMPLPLRDEGRELGDVVVRIHPDDTLSLPKAGLLTALKGALDTAAMARLSEVAATDGYVDIAQLTAAGVAIAFDPASLALKLTPKVDQRPVGDISLASPRGIRQSAVAAQPAIVSGYLNVIAGVDQRWGSNETTSAASGRFELESVFRLWNVVVENDFRYDGIVDTNTCPKGAVCSYTHEQGLKRRRSRLVYDWPEDELRLQLGDADVFGTGFQRTADVAGFTIEKSPRKLQPGESIRPSGRSSFRIERPSEIEVLVNGAVVQKLRLRAGNYNLSDLPLGTGANDVQLRITDDMGAQRTLAFTTFFDASLLGAGKNEWSVSAGLPSYFRDDERAYKTQDILATAFYRRGLTDQLTGEVHAQGDKQVIMGGRACSPCCRGGWLAHKVRCRIAPRVWVWAST